MKQMIEKKNKMLKEAGEALKEIWKIHRMMDTVEIDSVNFRTLVGLVNDKLARLSCSYGDYLDESELYLPEAEEGDPESELEALEDDLPFVTPDGGDAE